MSSVVDHPMFGSAFGQDPDADFAPGWAPILFSAPMVRAILAGKKTQTRRLVRTVQSCHDPGRAAPAFIVRRGEHKGSCVLLDEKIGPAWSPAGDMPLERYEDDARLSPYGAPGDRLWVRETWSKDGVRDLYPFPSCWYRADFDERDDPAREQEHVARAVRGHCIGTECWACWQERSGPFRWRPSIHMPRWASRITLEITGVRVERLQDLSETDACAEGIEGKLWPTFLDGPGSTMLYGHEGGHTTARGAFAELWDEINGKRAPWASNPWVWVVEFSRVR